MELMTLNSSFQPDKLVENYESFIWTERYKEAGDFEVVSSDIHGLMALLPRESFVCLRESTVPMVVENHKITKGPRQAPQISVTGRSFETVLERRASVKTALPGVRTAWMIAATSESDAAFMAIRTVIGDVSKYQNGVQILPLQNPAISANDAIPEVILTLPMDYATSAWSAVPDYPIGSFVGVGTTIYQSISSPNIARVPPNPTYWTPIFSYTGVWGAPKLIEIPPGELYATVMGLLEVNHHGLKAVRPTLSNDKVSIEIYNGANLTDSVVFDARFDQLDSATYLLSAQASTNVAYVYSTNGSSSILKTTAPEPSGLVRRVLLVDATDDSTTAGTNEAETRRSRGVNELYQHNVTAMVDGEISEQVAEGFNKDYFLGDILKLVAEYGLTRNVRVSEFIRTSDATGEKAYPAFEAVE